MKILKYMAVALMACAGLQYSSAQAPVSYPTAQGLVTQKTLQSLQDELRKEGYAASIDNNKLAFNKKGTTFWIEAHGSTMPLYFTVNAKGFSINRENDKMTIDERHICAANAATTLNAQSHCKVTFDNGTIDFYMPIYSSDVADIAKSMDAITEALQTARDNFQRTLKKAEEDYLAQENNTNVEVIEQIKPLAKTPVPCEVTGFQIRVVDAAGNEVIGYDKSIRKDKALFLQEAVTIATDVAGTATVGVRIYNPAGKLLVPYTSAEYTTINTIDLKKNKKGNVYELDKFGFATPGQWEAGEYRIEFVINDEVHYSGSFTIL